MPNPRRPRRRHRQNTRKNRSLGINRTSCRAQKIMTVPPQKTVKFENGFAKNNAIVTEVLQIILAYLPFIAGSLLIIIGIAIFANDKEDYAPAISFAVFGGITILFSGFMALLLKTSQYLVENMRRTAENTANIGLLLQQLLQRQAEAQGSPLPERNSAAIIPNAAALPAYSAAVSNPNPPQQISAPTLPGQNREQPVQLNKPQTAIPAQPSKFDTSKTVDSLLKSWES